MNPAMIHLCIIVVFIHGCSKFALLSIDTRNGEFWYDVNGVQDIRRRMLRLLHIKRVLNIKSYVRYD